MDQAETRTRRGHIVTAVLVLVLVSGLFLASGTQASGSVTCTAGASSLQMSWSGEGNAFRYEAFVSKDGTETSQILAWGSRLGTASVTFSSLPIGTYNVWVVKQTTDGSWIQFGDRTCTVTEATTTTAGTTTTTAATTTTAPSSGWAGTLSCTTSSATVRVTLDAAEGTRYFEVTLEHPSGYPRVSHLRYAESSGSFWTEFTSVAQGPWNLSGTATFNDGTTRQLNNLSCTVPAPSFGTTTTTTTAPPNSEATGAPTISGTAQVGETLTADTSGIADADGLTDAIFLYQWLSSRDTVIEGATNSTYTVQVSDVDKELRVRVTFVDDAGNQEILTSAATSAVVAGGL